MLQGDGISYETLTDILENMKKHKWSADNIAFGSGGLYKVFRLSQGSTNVPSGRPGQVGFEVGQVTFQGHLPDGQALGPTLHRFTF